MNHLLEVKLRYNHEKRSGGAILTDLRKGGETSVGKVEKLQENLRAVVRYYESTPKYLKGYLIDVHYNDIIAKSKRISELLRPIGKQPNDVVVGARFSNVPEGQENHIITYYVDKKTIQKTLEKLDEVKRFLVEKLNGKAVPENFNEEKNPELGYEGYSTKSTVRNMVVDCSVVEFLSVPNVTADEKKESFLLTFFQTEYSLSEMLEELQIDRYRYPYTFYGRDTISASWDLYQILQDKVPYMISMISSDLSQVTWEMIDESKKKYEQFIPKPSNEPTIGVIDNLFDEEVYFSEWVENMDCLDEFETTGRRDAPRDHGTEVTSIIVDGVSLNPWLDDGCGRFKVRHFGVCVDKISVPRLVNKIKKIVNDNPDIHVWNLSLGTDDEVSKNFISYDGSLLDELQTNKNIIFVVSGTNDNRGNKNKESMLRVGSPADSLNAVVVNSVKRNGRPASYTREGTILSFFHKPDVSYYGGDYEENERIRACSSKDIEEVYGTSFAAPWIARKLSFLIDVIGFPREIAKALLIDSAAGWEFKTSTYKIQNQIGYGVVPIKMSDILGTDNEEIRFVLHGTASSYTTSNYAIPVPRDSDDKYPFIARATLCYFPPCSRVQGVDYTSRELSLRFGRVNRKGGIVDINDNIQDEAGHAIDERKSRNEFRKWENTKFISKILKKNRALNAYDERLWGIAITSKERLTASMTSNLNFGVVVTLREINGVNRIQDFIMACTLRGWIVNEINLENRLTLYNKNQEEIIFDDAQQVK